MATGAATLIGFLLGWSAAPAQPAEPTEPDVTADTDAEEPAPEPEGDTDAAPPDEGDDAGEPEGDDAGDTEPEGEPAKTVDPKTAGDEPEGDLTIDDIFGSEEDHTDVAKEGPAKTATRPDTAPATSKERRLSALERMRANLDTRIRIVSSVYYDVHRVEERQFSRNENRLEFYFAYTPNKHLQIVGDIEPVFLGVAQAKELDDLATMQMLTPFHVESDAAYIAINDLLPKLDLKVGRQIVVWGTADKFNPTNNINPDDLEDRPLFTEPIANQMVVVDYAPLDDKLWFQGVYVPLFYPALLPPSAAAALKDPETKVPFAHDREEQGIAELQALLRVNDGLVPVVNGHVQLPKRRFTDGQSAIKLGTSLGGVDMSISYYNGRHDIPTPIDVNSIGYPPGDPRRGPEGTKQCCFQSDVTLVYPRMQVLGLDFTTQLPFLGNLGVWGEGALFFPRRHDLYLEFPTPVDITPDDGNTNPVTFLYGETIRSTPFIKATAGIDYTFGKHVYVQLQYLRGFIDDFGVDHIGNYLVGGGDLLFFGRHLIFRAFGVVDFPTGKGDNGSYEIYPELMVTPPWGSVTFHLGSFFLLGAPDTKFGQKAAGSSIVFFKVEGTF